jgi:predicted phage tail protein
MKKNQHLISIRGAKGKGGGGSTFEADDNMFARQSAAFIDALCEGPIKGLVYGDASILIDEVRLRNVNEATGRISSTSNFNNFTVITKNGDATQVVDADFFAEYPSAATTKNIGSAELLEGEPQYFTISSGTFEKRETDYVKITVSTTGMSAITKKGDNQGDVNETNVFFTIDFNWVDNSGVHHTREMFDTGFQGKVSGKFAHTFGFNIEQIKTTSTINDWSVKVTKLTASPQSSSTVELQNAIYVDSIEAAIADKLEYPYTAYVGGVIDAEAFSSIPARGYEIDGKLIQVPTNHYPLDYNGRKLILSDASNFSIGDVISQTLSISSLVAAGTDEEGYTATATVSAHGVATGETFKATIATTATQDEDFFEGEFVCTAASSTTFTYTLNKPFDETANSGVGAYKTITSTTCTGTKTAVMFSGGLVDKKS